MSKVVATFNTIKGPKAIGPYSTVAIYNKMMFVSGQLGIDPATMELVSDDVELQTRQALDNLVIIFGETNTGFSHVIKNTIFLKVTLD